MHREDIKDERVRTADHGRHNCCGFGSVLQMSSEVFSQSAQADAREEVDGKSRVSGIVSRHDSLPGRSHRRIPSPEMSFVRK